MTNIGKWRNSKKLSGLSILTFVLPSAIHKIALHSYKLAVIQILKLFSVINKFSWINFRFKMVIQIKYKAKLTGILPLTELLHKKQQQLQLLFYRFEITVQNLCSTAMTFPTRITHSFVSWLCDRFFIVLSSQKSSPLLSSTTLPVHFCHFLFCLPLDNIAEYNEFKGYHSTDDSQFYTHTLDQISPVDI